MRTAELITVHHEPEKLLRNTLQDNAVSLQCIVLVFCEMVQVMSTQYIQIHFMAMTLVNVS